MSTEELPLMARTFVELADTLVDEFDVLDLLQLLTERSVELLSADGSGLMLADQRGDLQLMASTSEQVRHLELYELQIGQGPCTEAFTSGDPVTNVDLHDAFERWPLFTPAAQKAGFGATQALPMRLRGQRIGVLNLFSRSGSPMSQADLRIGQAMADLATVGLLHERNVREGSALSEQLESALHARVVMEQAMGMFSVRADVSPDEAFDLMRRYAKGSGTALTAVALAVLDGTLASARVLELQARR
jgi:GAF domain-containing protein